MNEKLEWTLPGIVLGDGDRLLMFGSLNNEQVIPRGGEDPLPKYGVFLIDRTPHPEHEGQVLVVPLAVFDGPWAYEQFFEVMKVVCKNAFDDEIVGFLKQGERPAGGTKQEMKMSRSHDTPKPLRGAFAIKKNGEEEPYARMKVTETESGRIWLVREELIDYVWRATDSAILLPQGADVYWKKEVEG